MNSSVKFVARAPARIDPAGGGTDAPPYCIDYGGAVVNFSVARYSYASFERLPTGSGAFIYSQDLKQGARADFGRDFKADGRLDFLKAFVKRLLSNETDFLIVTQSDIPERTGLGGSGAMGVAMLGAISTALGQKLSKDEIALLANEIERKDHGNSGGNQDSFGSAIGGAKLITYFKGGGCRCEQLKLPEPFLAQWERDTLLVYTGEVHLSGSIHTDIRNAYNMENSPTVRAMDNLKAAAHSMAQALQEGDIQKYIECLNDSRVNHYALHSSCDGPRLREFFDELYPFIRGGKTCGAGGGGFIMFHTKSAHRKECVEVAEAMGGKVWNVKLDREGLVVWEEPSSNESYLRGLTHKISLHHYVPKSAGSHDDAKTEDLESPSPNK